MSKTTTDLWQKEAMRLGGESLVRVIEEMHDSLAEIVKKLEDMEKANKTRDDYIAQFKDAFPANDYGGHRRYHEVLIAQLEERRRLRIAIEEKTISGVIWALILFMAAAAWQYVKSKIVTGTV